MKLIDYLNALPVEAREIFAAKCGTSFDYLRQVGYGNRACTETLAINLERESNRELLCETLCPKADWAFIRSTSLPGRAGRQPIDASKIMSASTEQTLVLGRRAPNAANPK